MVVLIVEKVKPSLRGEITRWMIQPRAGVFVGKMSGIVRDKLWEKVMRSATAGGGMMIYSSNTEQGFGVRSFGDTTRLLVDKEGIILSSFPRKHADTSPTASQPAASSDSSG